MTIDPVELERLSKAATQEDDDVRYYGGPTSTHRPARDAYHAALVQLHRTGQLVPAQPSGDVVEAVAERARKFPSDWNWPPSASEDDVNDAIDGLCGCAGKYDCRCVSVFNRTCQQMWWDHNTARAALGEQP